MTNEDHSRLVQVASGINILLGIWLLNSFWIYGYDVAGASQTNVIVGIFILVFAATRFTFPQKSAAPSVANVVLGIWTLIFPWSYGYSMDADRIRTEVIVGIAVIVLAIWSGSTTYLDHRQQRIRSPHPNH